MLQILIATLQQSPLVSQGKHPGDPEHKEVERKVMYETMILQLLYVEGFQATASVISLVHL